MNKGVLQHAATTSQDQSSHSQSKLIARHLPHVKSIFTEEIEFDSKAQPLHKLSCSVEESVLEAILEHLACNNQITMNKDNSLTWIDAEDNEKLKKSYEMQFCCNGKTEKDNPKHFKRVYDMTLSTFDCVSILGQSVRSINSVNYA